MPILRRSINNNNNNPSSSSNTSTSASSATSPPLPLPLARPSEKVAPPQKVIKALRTHKSTNPQELSYQAGDFWYVTGEREGWFEALNPLTGSRGLVPRTDFEEFMKGGRASGSSGPQRQGSGDSTSRSQTPSQGHSSYASDPRTPPIQTPPVQAARKPKQPVYAIVMYDFFAERPDELDARRGEPIVVIAQSNHEWFVAKPIGRLGGPGLIPTSFVEIRDPSTGKPLDWSSDTIPMVEEWKKATADYKAAAIPLGRFDMADQGGVVDSPYAPSRKSQPTGAASSGNASQTSLPRSGSTSSVSNANIHNTNGSSVSIGNSNKRASPVYRPEEDATLPPGAITALAVPSFHNESGNYWFRLAAQFQPDDRSAPAYSLSLYRTYEDFYDFQISLLDTFPFEAGRSAPGQEDQPPPERILPYMPGPVEEEIDDELTEYRREELDAYVKALVDLGGRGASYILRHELFRGFFAAKYGDHCQEMERQDAVEELDERLGGMSLANGDRKPSGSGSASGGAINGNGAAHGNGNDSGNGNGNNNGNGRLSSGYGYSVDQRAPSAMSRHSERSAGTGPQSQNASGMGRASPQNQQPLASINGHQQQQQQQYGHSRSTSRGVSPMPPPPMTDRNDSYDSLAHRPESSNQNHSGYSHNTSRSISGSGSTRQSDPPQPTGSTTSHFSAGFPTATTTSSFGHAAPLGSANASGQGGAGQPPYIKIKIYDRATDDLIAIRVHPNVSHAELFEKVRARLGSEVTSLRYKESSGGGGGGYGEIGDDRALKDWLRIEDQKLVLYAEQD